MPGSYPTESHIITRNGKEIPTVAFFGAKGGVGKTTIARLFAELVISASDRDSHHPNVLLIDFDVDHRGLTVQMASNIIYRCATVHEQIVTNNAAGADAVDVSTAVSLRGGTIADRGRLYLMPSAPKEATNVFRVIADIDVNNLLDLLTDMIQRVVDRYDISCVVIDCGPVVNPYTAAASELATAAFIIGQNEPITYESIDVQKARIRDMYPSFNGAKLKVIINKVRGYEQLDQMKKRREIFFDIPFTIDIVDASEGVKNVSELRLLLFENYLVELIKQVLIGYPDLIPQGRVLLGDEWIDLLSKAPQLEQTPKMKRLAWLCHLKLAGVLVALLGIAVLFLAFFAGRRWPDSSPHQPTTAGTVASAAPSVPAIAWWQRSSTLNGIGIILLLSGAGIFTVGRYAASQRQRLSKSIVQLNAGGPDWLFEQIKKGPTARSNVEELQKISKTLVPDD